MPMLSIWASHGWLTGTNLSFGFLSQKKSLGGFQWASADKTDNFLFLRFSFVFIRFFGGFHWGVSDKASYYYLKKSPYGAVFHQQWVGADKAIDNFLSHLLDFAARTFSTLFVNVKTHRRDFQQEFIYWKKNRFSTKIIFNINLFQCTLCEPRRGIKWSLISLGLISKAIKTCQHI